MNKKALAAFSTNLDESLEKQTAETEKAIGELTKYFPVKRCRQLIVDKHKAWMAVHGDEIGFSRQEADAVVQDIAADDSIKAGDNNTVLDRFLDSVSGQTHRQSETMLGRAALALGFLGVRSRRIRLTLAYVLAPIIWLSDILKVLRAKDYWSLAAKETAYSVVGWWLITMEHTREHSRGAEIVRLTDGLLPRVNFFDNTRSIDYWEQEVVRKMTHLDRAAALEVMNLFAKNLGDEIKRRQNGIDIYDGIVLRADQAGFHIVAK